MIERKYLAHYIDANMDGLSTNYVRLGKNLETYSEELNPNVSVIRNIRGAPSIEFDGYEVTSKVETYYIDANDPLFEVLSRIANRRLNDKRCKTTKVDVLVDKSGNVLWAYREECWVVPVYVGGDTSGVQIPFNVYCSGNRVHGTFNFETRKFTNTEEPEEEKLSPLTVTENGVYTAEEGRGYSPVTVNVPIIDTESLSVNSNGVYSAPSGVAYDSVSVNVPTVNVNNLSVTGNGRYVAPSGTAYGVVNVNVEGGRVNVNFIDYDGTILHSYTAEEIQALSTLPSNPSHTGLTAQGWNWTLAQIKNYLTNNPDAVINVGQMYTTASGKTEIDVSMPEGRLSPILTICPNGTLSVDWGDNTTPDTVTGTSTTTRQAVSHTYAQAGNYTISISVVSGSFGFYGDSSGQYTLFRKGTVANENMVYANCVRAIRLGGGITSIGGYAFINCRSLTSVTIPSSVMSIGTYAFYYCYSLVSVTIPSGVTSIWDSAFNYCYSLTSVMIPSSVTSIGAYAFQHCYVLASITIPSGVTSIGGYAFNSCRSFASVTIPSGVTSIGFGAFQNCSALTSVTIPSGVTRIEAYVFQYCYSLASVTIPSGVTSIGDYAFQSCYSLASVMIPSSVMSIGNYAFQFCYPLISVTIPSGVTSIGNSAFESCSSLASVTIPSSVTSIGSNAFVNCRSLASVTIPSGVTSIGGYVFRNCSVLASVTIPSGVTSIGNYAFGGCYGMKEYHLEPTTPPTLPDASAFSDNPSDCIIYVPQGSLSAYQTAAYWSTYASRMQGE